jgi:hypothetical protein
MAAGAQRCARAVIEYDGTAFAGSQVQPNARTVQGELEEALNRLIGERTRVRLAGRTDAGVHATGQVASFCLPRRGRGAGMDWRELRQRLNAVLLLALGIPCSAQLATIMGILGGISFSALLTLFGVVVAQMFLVGFLAARVLPGQRSDFILELPPLRWPRGGSSTSCRAR